MTIFGKSEKAFENFIVADGAIKFPELGADGASIKVVPGYSVIKPETSDIEAAAKSAFANVIGGQVTKEKTTELSLNGKTFFVLTDSLTDFVNSLGSASKKDEEIASIYEDLADQPVALGAFVVGIVANAELTAKLEAIKDGPAIDEADARLKGTVNKDLKELNELAKVTSLAKPPSTFGKIKAKLISSVSITDALSAVNEQKAEAAKGQLVLVRSRASKAARAVYGLVKYVVGKGLAGAAAVPALTVSAAKKAAGGAKALATKETAKKVALTTCGFAIGFTTFFYATPENINVLFEPVEEPVVEETSNAVYAASAAGIALAGYGAVKAKQTYDQFAKSISAIAS